MPFGLSFTNPWALALFPPLAIYFVWLARRSLADLSPARRALATGIRLLLTGLIVLALAGLQIVKFNRDVATMFVLDYSDSISPEAKVRELEYVQNAVKTKRDNDRAGIVVFGRDAYIELAPSTSRSVDKIQTVTSTQFTDIAAAIRLGMASLPDGMQKRLVVFVRRQREFGRRSGRSVFGGLQRREN